MYIFQMASLWLFVVVGVGLTRLSEQSETSFSSLTGMDMVKMLATVVKVSDKDDSRAQATLEVGLSWALGFLYCTDTLKHR